MYPTYWKDEDGYINVAHNLLDEESLHAEGCTRVTEAEYQAWQMELN